MESDRYLADRVLVNIDAYYSYEIYGADGSFRTFDSYVRAGLEYDGHLPPNRVKMRHEVLVDTTTMTPYGVFTFTGKRSFITPTSILSIYALWTFYKQPSWLFIAHGLEMSANGLMGLHVVGKGLPSMNPTQTLSLVTMSVS